MFKLNIIFSRIMGIGAVQRQSVVSLVWQIAITFIGFFSTMYFAHAVGADVLGAFFLFMAYFGIISLITDGGFGGATVKRISEGEEPDAYFSASVILRSLFVTVVLLVLIAFHRYFVDLDSSGTFIWLLIALIVSLLQGTVSNGINGRGKMGIFSTANFIGNIWQILFQVIAVFLGYGVAGLAGGLVTGMLVGSFVQLRFLDLHFVSFGWRHLKSLFSFSFWLFLISGGSMVFMYSDTVLIGYYMSNADVGVYRVLFQFTSLAAFTTNALRGALWPKVSRWDKIGETGLIEMSLSRALTYSLILALPLFMGGALLGDKLLYFFYGAEFGNYPTLMILFLVQIVNIFQYFFTTYLSAMNQLKELFKITVVAIVANIALNALLIPIMGISGAAIATLVTMAIHTILAMKILSRRITLRLELSSLQNILKASIIMGLVVGGYRFIVPLTSIWLALIPVVLGGVIYGVLLLKLDRNIYEELKGIMVQMNVGWPKWM